MICKNCGAAADEGTALCPQCGAPLEETPGESAAPVETLTAVETLRPAEPAPVEDELPEEPETEAAGSIEEPEAAGPELPEGPLPLDAEDEAVIAKLLTTDDPPEEAQPAGEEPPAEPPKRKEPVWLIAALCVVAVAALAILIFSLIPRGGKDQPAPQPDAPAVSAPVNQPASEPAGEPAGAEEQADGSEKEPAPTYTVPSDQITSEMAAAVAAACSERELSNTELSYYYWNQFYSMANAYGEYLSFMLDPEQPLSEQSSASDPEKSWEEFLLDAALETFHQTTAIVKVAEEAGFTLDDEAAEYLELLPDSLTNSAERMELSSADEFLQRLYGPYAGVESYTRFVHDSLVSYGYLNLLFDGIEYGPGDVAAWFDENRETYEAQGLNRDEPNMVNVRHILIKAEAAEGDGTEEEGTDQDAAGTGESSDQAWLDAKNRAEELLAQWQAGDATEDSFAVLASENTEDPGSQGTGGLYEGVYPGEMVAAFNDWCFDESRKPGDTGIVETEYGFHIMYFVQTQDHAHWYETAEQGYLSHRQQEILEDLTADYPLETNYDKIVLMESMILQ